MCVCVGFGVGWGGGGGGRGGMLCCHLFVAFAQWVAVPAQRRYSAAWEVHVLSNLPFFTVLLPLFLQQSVVRVEVRGESSVQDVVNVRFERGDVGCRWLSCRQAVPTTSIHLCTSQTSLQPALPTPLGCDLCTLHATN